MKAFVEQDTKRMREAEEKARQGTLSLRPASGSDGNQANSQMLDELRALNTDFKTSAGAQLELFKNQRTWKLPQEMEELHEFCQRTKNADLAGRLVYNDDGEVVFNFGKHRGTLVKDLLDKEPGYYGWMMNGHFPRYTLRVLKQIKEGTFGK